MSDDVEDVPDQSEELDQLQSDDTLIDRGVDDVLDEGYVPPDHWSAAEGYGNTAAEQERGETLDQRLRQEEPDNWNLEEEATSDEGRESFEDAADEVGDSRAGRLVAPDETDGEDVEPELLADEVGIDGGAASAEEAAVHVIDSGDEAQDDGVAD